MKRRTRFWTSGFIKWIYLLLVCALFLTLLGFPSVKSAQAAGQVYYVDNSNGRDTNNGLSENTPWKTIAKVNSVSFVPGDQILFKRGETWKAILTPLTSGIAGSPIVFGSYSTGPLPIIDCENSRWTSVDMDGKSYLTFQELDCRAGPYYGLAAETNGADHITVQDCVITGAAYNGIRIANSQYILVENCHISDCDSSGIAFVKNILYSRAHNNVVHDCFEAGIMLGETITTNQGCYYNEIDGNDCYANKIGGLYLNRADHNLIHDNHFHHNIGGNEPYGIGVRSGSYNEIYDNEINDNAVHGIEVFSADTSASMPLDYTSNGNKIYQNKIYNNALSGIAITSPTVYGARPVSNEVYYNLIYDNGGAGFGVTESVVSSGNTGNKLYNNTIVGNLGIYGGSLELSGIYFSNTGGWDVKNNIVADNVKAELQCSGNNTPTITHGHNLYHRTSGDLVEHPYHVYYDATEIVAGFEAMAVVTDPLFVDETNHDYHLQSTSPAINAGTDVSLTTDYDGNPISGQPDIGAYEYKGTLTPPTPTLTLAIPNGGESWQIGSNQTLQWSSTNLTGNVKLELSRNGGTGWETLFASVANSGSQVWAVSGLATTSALLRITGVENPNISDISDSVFTLTAPAPTPPTSFTLAGQVTQADNSGLNGVTLSLSDGGGSVVTANGGLYSLTVPSGWSGQLTPSYSNGSFDPVARLYSNVSANQSGQDFRWTAPVVSPTIRVISPNGGESWETTSKRYITWTASNLAGNVSIQLSRDGGVGWETLFANTANDGQEQWTVSGSVGNRNRIRIVSVNSPLIYKTSDKDFTIFKAKKKFRLSLTQGWNLVTVPFQSTSNAVQVFASLPSGWTIYSWDSARLRYTLATEINPDIGTGYWLKSPITTDLEIEGDLNDAPQFTKDLAMGWNQIGSPSTDSYELSNLRIIANETVYSYQEAVDRKLIATSIYSFFNNRYETANSTGILNPGFGYWIRALTNCKIIF